tara:strand:+ start:1725 stop:2009 length:285 start_codon:yes stop_codon:yes gene_type:complete
MPFIIPFIKVLFTIYTIRQVAKRVAPPAAAAGRQIVKNMKSYVDANVGDFNPIAPDYSSNPVEFVEKAKKQKVKKIYIFAAILLAVLLIKKTRK